MSVTIDLPWPPQALWSNARKHRMEAYRAKTNYQLDCFYLFKEMRARLDQHLEHNGLNHVKVTFHPKGVGREPDKDNCIGAFKYGQDELARALGIDDKVFNEEGKMRHVMGERVPGGRVVVEVI